MFLICRKPRRSYGRRGKTFFRESFPAPFTRGLFTEGGRLHPELMSAGRSTSFTFSPALKFGSSLFKGLRFPKAEPWSPSAEGEIPLNGIFFLQSFFFCACYGQKKKRRSPLADKVSAWSALPSAIPVVYDFPASQARKTCGSCGKVCLSDFSRLLLPSDDLYEMHFATCRLRLLYAIAK